MIMQNTMPKTRRRCSIDDVMSILHVEGNMCYCYVSRYEDSVVNCFRDICLGKRYLFRHQFNIFEYIASNKMGLEIVEYSSLFYVYEHRKTTLDFYMFYDSPRSCGYIMIPMNNMRRMLQTQGLDLTNSQFRILNEAGVRLYQK